MAELRDHHRSSERRRAITDCTESPAFLPIGSLPPHENARDRSVVIGVGVEYEPGTELADIEQTTCLFRERQISIPEQVWLDESRAVVPTGRVHDRTHFYIK